MPAASSCVRLDELRQLPRQIAADAGAGDDALGEQLLASRLAPWTPVHATSPTA